MVVRSMYVVCVILEVTAGDSRLEADWEKGSTQNKNFLTFSEAQRQGELLPEDSELPNSMGHPRRSQSPLQGPFYNSKSLHLHSCVG